MTTSGKMLEAKVSAESHEGSRHGRRSVSVSGVFLWALLGSGGLEAIAALRFITSGKIPHYYRRPWFWLTRIGVAGMAGGLAVAYFSSNQINTPLMAISIGAAAPALLDSLRTQHPAGA